ncbi:MAG: hypothetical protein AAGA78_07390 [Pseudomonadota bacterium]
MLALGVCTGVHAPLYNTGQAGSAPLVLAAPNLIGVGEVGQTLTVEPGAYESDPPAVISVEWRRNGQLMASQSGLTYTIGAVDAGSVLFACVRAENPSGITEVCTPVMPIYPNTSVDPWHVVTDLDLTIWRSPGAPFAPSVSTQNGTVTLS